MVYDIDQRIIIKQTNDVLLLATIRWSGVLPSKKGLWYGIVYDEPHGKHNGSYNGKVYFDCPPQYGSFVRENKISTEISLVNAIKMQYTRDLSMEKVAGQAADSQVFFNNTPIEDLTTISVNDLPVHDVEKGLLAQLCPRIKAFDCSNCPLRSWSEVHNAVHQSTAVHLVCSRNKLPIFDNTLR